MQYNGSPMNIEEKLVKTKQTNSLWIYPGNWCGTPKRKKNHFVISHIIVLEYYYEYCGLLEWRWEVEKSHKRF